MIQMMSAYTTEAEEVKDAQADALAEILKFINIKDLKKSTVGLVNCNYDFIRTEFISELCRKLPFDIIGMTTMAGASRHGKNRHAFTLTVLTSDEVIFKTAMTRPLKPDDYEEKIETAYSAALKNLSGNPAAILAFFPYHRELSGTVMLKALDKISGGIPVWGGIATNMEDSYEQCCAFRNNDTYEDGIAMLMMHGPVNPEFIVVSVPEQNIRKNRGNITASDGCVLKEINGIPAIKYIEKQGVIIIKGAPVVSPFMVYYEGTSEPVALGVYTVNDDGSLLCGGEMPPGASLAIGEITTEGILASAAMGMKRLLESGKRNGALLLPCVSRYIMLVPDHKREMELVGSRLGNGRV
ncbi:MAG: FIST C-terminal domain-containing protein, partial [Treponema sp.]|nr:FIST C-terminal domain-containing protein [Treponema sp.]